MRIAPDATAGTLRNRKGVHKLNPAAPPSWANTASPANHGGMPSSLAMPPNHRGITVDAEKPSALTHAKRTTVLVFIENHTIVLVSWLPGTCAFQFSIWTMIFPVCLPARIRSYAARTSLNAKVVSIVGGGNSPSAMAASTQSRARSSAPGRRSSLIIE
jgi:hypothetical protein